MRPERRFPQTISPRGQRRSAPPSQSSPISSMRQASTVVLRRCRPLPGPPIRALSLPVSCRWFVSEAAPTWGLARHRYKDKARRGPSCRRSSAGHRRAAVLASNTKQVGAVGRLVWGPTGQFVGPFGAVRVPLGQLSCTSGHTTSPGLTDFCLQKGAWPVDRPASRAQMRPEEAAEL